MSWLENVQWDRFGKSLQDLWAAPSSNLGASLLFVAAVGIVLLIFVFIGIVIIYGLSLEDEDDDDEDDEDEEYEEEDSDTGDAGSADSPPSSGISGDGPEAETQQRQRFPRWARGVVWLTFLVLAFIVFDVMVGSSDVCLSCHTEGPHARRKSDPHAATPCVRCHEDRAGLAMFSSSAARGLHAVSAAVSPSLSGGYGSVTARACNRCHKKQIAGTRILKDQELRISHAQPLEGGAICTDCHLLDDQGAIAERNRGMTTCMRCHDGKRASNECSECHLGDPSAAIRDEEKDMVFSATILVPDYRCGGCHKDQSKCDKCHGLRMPHSKEFTDFKHAKSAAFEKKASCVKVCHLPGQCNTCHRFDWDGTISGHATDWRQAHGAGRSMQSACACHAPDDDPEKPFCPVCHD